MLMAPQIPIMPVANLIKAVPTNVRKAGRSAYRNILIMINSIINSRMSMQLLRVLILF
jgi:hypothetical protein